MLFCLCGGVVEVGLLAVVLGAVAKSWLWLRARWHALRASHVERRLGLSGLPRLEKALEEARARAERQRRVELVLGEVGESDHATVPKCDRRRVGSGSRNMVTRETAPKDVPLGSPEFGPRAEDMLLPVGWKVVSGGRPSKS